MARYKVDICEKFVFLRAQGGIQGTLLMLICFKIRSAWNKGNFGNLGNLASTDFFKLRTIHNNSNNGNNRNNDLDRIGSK